MAKRPSTESMLVMLILEIVACAAYVFIVSNILGDEHLDGPIRLLMSIPACGLVVCMLVTVYKLDRRLYAR